MIVNGTHFPDRTPAAIAHLLEEMRATRRPVRIDYGDPVTGKSWGHDWDNEGFIGRSQGEPPRALLMARADSLGGIPIASESIVAVLTADGSTLWRHPHYQPSYDWQGAVIVPARDHHPDFPFELRARRSSGQAPDVVARFSTEAMAAEWLDRRRRMEPPTTFPHATDESRALPDPGILACG